MDRFKKVLFGFKVIYLLYLLLAFNAFVNGTAWMNMASYVITLMGLALVLWMLTRYRRYQRAYSRRLLVAFVLSYLISAATHLSYGFAENIKGTIWLVLPILLMYITVFDMSGDEIRTEMKWLSLLYIVYCTIANVISLSMVYWGRKYDYTDASGNIHAIGYRWSRLWGLYDDPNHGATITVIALLLLIYLFARTTQIWKKTVVVISLVVNYLYLSFSDSRTGLIAFAAGLIMAGFLFFWIQMKNHMPRKQAVVPLLCAVAAAGLVFAGDYGVQQSFKKIDQKLASMFEENTHQPPPDVNNGARKKNLNQDYSNGRTEIWGAGFDIVKQNAIIGVGYRNITEYVKEQIPDSFLVSNGSGVQYDSMHNLEMDVLVSQGLVGVLFLVLIGGNTAVILYRKFHYAPAVVAKENVWSASIAVALLIASTFLSFIFYVNAPQNLCFWIFLGYTMRLCQIGSDKEAL